jgi:hypothetical protein
MAVSAIQIENHDPSDLLDAITSALQDGETTWLTEGGKRRVVIAPAPPLPATEPGELTYEGEVRYADGTRVSLQCFENRCGECPDETTEGDEADGPLKGGYNCVHYCDHGPAGSRAGAAGPPAEDHGPQSRRLDEPAWPGEDVTSRNRAGTVLTGAGVAAADAAMVLRRAYGHLSATAFLPGTDKLAQVTYDRETGQYAVTLPSATEMHPETREGS